MKQMHLFDYALLPSGWARDVRIEVENGFIVSVETGASQGATERIRGAAIPGLPNVHSHAFQRAMAGLTERRGTAHDSFWTWRESMYSFLRVLGPDDVEAISVFAYMEMLEAGLTTVGEFHYLHHDVDGTPYTDIGETAARIIAAAGEASIALTILPSLYTSGGFGGLPPTAGQLRFVNSVDRFLTLVHRTQEIGAKRAGVKIGIAPHSLRAVTADELMRVVAAFGDGPIHIHAAEQIKEVEDCRAHCGTTPVDWLLNNLDPGRRWCLIHATHMSQPEAVALAKSGAVAGLCPLTEANLGDGIFPGEEFVVAGGRLGIGTDSNIQIDAAAELRQLEYAQRLGRRRRNVLATQPGQSVGHWLYVAALEGGAQALAQSIGRIEAGYRADIVVLDLDHPSMLGGPRTWLDIYIFSVGRRLIQTVFVAGQKVVENGLHRNRDRIVSRYARTMKRLLDVAGG